MERERQRRKISRDVRSISLYIIYIQHQSAQIECITSSSSLCLLSHLIHSFLPHTHLSLSSFSHQLLPRWSSLPDTRIILYPPSMHKLSHLSSHTTSQLCLIMLVSQFGFTKDSLLSSQMSGVHLTEIPRVWARMGLTRKPTLNCTGVVRDERWVLTRWLISSFDMFYFPIVYTVFINRPTVVLRHLVNRRDRIYLWSFSLKRDDACFRENCGGGWMWHPNHHSFTDLQ